MNNNLLRIQCIILVTVLSFITGTSSLAWCQHYGADNNNHIIEDLTDHGEAHSHRHMASDKNILGTSCREHSHNCVHISLVQRTLTSNHTILITRIISNSCQPVQFQSTDRDVSFVTANEPLRFPSCAAPPYNLQLASLQTIVLRN